VYVFVEKQQGRSGAGQSEQRWLLAWHRRDCVRHGDAGLVVGEVRELRVESFYLKVKRQDMCYTCIAEQVR
jgi:hypothetical protein